MMRRLALLLLGLVGLLPCGGAPAQSIATGQAFAPTLGRDIGYIVLLPEGYAASGLRYPVLYLLHGYNGAPDDWLSRGDLQGAVRRLVAEGRIPPSLVVMPAGGASWYVDREEKMETAFMRDFIPAIEQQHRALSERNARAIAGFSMGGYGALRLALKYPDAFRAAALFSPAIYVPQPPANSSARRVGVFANPAFDGALWESLNYPALLEGFLARGLTLPVFINSGDDDEYQIEQQAARLYGELRRHRQPAELRIVNGTHGWAAWTPGLAEALPYILGGATAPQAK